MKRLLENGRVQEALRYIRQDDERTLAEQLAMCEIPAPSFQEKRRAEYVRERFQEIGLENVHTDKVWNVMGTIPGTGDGPAIMLAGHLDTVFPMDTDVTVRKEENIYHCPGINDDTRAVAELFTIARAMKAAGLRLKGDLIFCANVCEEGLGDLKGIKHIFENGPQVDGFVSIDDPKTGGIVYKAVGSKRYEVRFTGKGGHSLTDFGLPNPVHAMGRAIQKISDFQVPKSPRTTFNVGVVQGGTSVNTISGSASMLVDLRSVSSEELSRLSGELKEAVRQAVEEENCRWESKEKVQAEILPKGDRPAGIQEEDSPIVQAAREAALLVGMKPQLLDACSTDANIPISLGIPAITVGRGGREGGVHTLQEWFEPVESWLGPQRDLLLVLELGGLDGCAEPMIQRRREKVMLKIVSGDITKVKTDAIVNAANTSLLGGGGVDGAIHRAAGPELLAECRMLHGCRTGQAKITKGYRLPAKYVIHTPGPVWNGGSKGEEALLQSCYENCLKLAVEHGCQTVAFPSISTGIYHFPLEKASVIAVRTILGFCREHPDIQEVQMVCFDERTRRFYEEALKEALSGGCQ